MQPDYYAILEIPPTSSADEVRQAYRRLARRWHPDKHGGSAESEERFKSIVRAYQILSDVDSRVLFDHQRAHKTPAASYQPAPPTRVRPAVHAVSLPAVLRRYWWVPFVALLVSAISIGALNLPYRSQLPWHSAVTAPVNNPPNLDARGAMASPGWAAQSSAGYTELKLPAGKASSEHRAVKPVRPLVVARSMAPSAPAKPTTRPDVANNPLPSPTAEAPVKSNTPAPAPEAVSTEVQAQWYQFGLTEFENKNYESAARWFRKAADQGNASAKVHLATMYMNGLGVAKDPAAARALYQQVARKNRP